MLFSKARVTSFSKSKKSGLYENSINTPGPGSYQSDKAYNLKKAPLGK